MCVCLCGICCLPVCVCLSVDVCVYVRSAMHKVSDYMQQPLLGTLWQAYHRYLRAPWQRAGYRPAAEALHKMVWAMLCTSPSQCVCPPFQCVCHVSKVSRAATRASWVGSRMQKPHGSCNFVWSLCLTAQGRAELLSADVLCSFPLFRQWRW